MKYFIFPALFCLVFLSACKKETFTTGTPADISSKKTTLDVPLSYQNGRLVFASQADFESLIDQGVRDTINPHRVLDYVNSATAQSFISYSVKKQMDALNSAPQQGQSSDQDGNVEDPPFAEVLNQNGEVQVANTIYKVTPQGTFAVLPANINQLNAMLDYRGMLNAPYLTSLVEIDSDNGVYKVAQGIYLMDTYGYVRTGATYNGGGSQINSIHKTINATPGDPYSAAYSNFEVYPFSSSSTIAGKIIDGIFGDAHYKNFQYTPDRRLKVDFYNRNWLIYSSLTVRAVIQKKTILGMWGPVQNMDEMRLGWTPIVIKLDIPKVTRPNTTPVPDLSTLPGKLLKNKINLLLGDTEYLSLQVQDVLDANTAFPFLSSSITNKLNHFSFDVNGFVNKQVDNEINQLYALLLQRVGYAAPHSHLGFLYNDNFMINAEESIKTQGDGAMSKTFLWNSAMVGFSNDVFIFKPAKNVELVSGSAYAAGKLNGEWVGIAVQKNYPFGWTVTPAARRPQEGQFIRNDNNGMVYIVMDGKLRYIPSQDVLNGLFDFSENLLQHYTSAGLSGFPVGNPISPNNGLIADSSTGKVYFREKTVIRYITSMEKKVLYHFNWAHIIYVNSIGSDYVVGSDI